MNDPVVNEGEEQPAEKKIRSAARRVIAKMARLAFEEDEPATASRYQSMLAQLALAQVALAYPKASLGVCMADGAPLRFEAKDDGLYVCCSAGSGPRHGWKIGG
ncbi:MAG TPA: hypothetical protein VNK95_12220 [Caldilineaceae bacterium]|nr:hypothetical protein [Caldilineaceae bacterium]